MSLIPRLIRPPTLKVFRNVPRLVSPSTVLRAVHDDRPNKPESFKSSKLKKLGLVAAASAAIGLGLYSIGNRSRLNFVQTTKMNPNGPKGSLRERFNFIDKVVKQCASSVVYIEIRDPKKIDPETGQFVVSSNGSGFFVRDDGWILTNAHVVINKPQSIVMVMLQDGSVYQATIEDADMNIDLALLKIQCDRKVPFLRLGNTSDVSTGEWVIALGSPLSLSHTVTAGVISAVSREAGDLGLRNFSMRYLQTDAAITFGNSGGPLVNLDGDVVGINNLRVTAGIAFAIPVEYAKKFLERSQWSSSKSVLPLSADAGKKIFLGITTISVTPGIIGDLQQVGGHQSIPSEVTHGVFVWKVTNGSPAHSSGLKVGDIITHVNGFPIYEARDIYAFLSPESPSFNKLAIIRKGKQREIDVEPL